MDGSPGSRLGAAPGRQGDNRRRGTRPGRRPRGPGHRRCRIGERLSGASGLYRSLINQQVNNVRLPDSGVNALAPPHTRPRQSTPTPQDSIDPGGDRAAAGRPAGASLALRL